MATKYWLTGKSGVFGTAANWDVGTVPGAGDDAIIDATGTYTVTSSVSTTVLDVSTINTATLSIATGTTFTATDGTGSGVNAGIISVANGAVFDIGAGAFENTGKVSLAGSSTPTEFRIAGDVTLVGGGAVLLSDSSSNFIDNSTYSSTLTLGGTFRVGDTFTVKFTNSQITGGSESVSVPTATASSLSTLATLVANAINGDAKLIAANITASATGAIITISEPGAIASTTVVSDTITSGSTITAALSPTTGHLTADTAVTPSNFENIDNTISGAGTIGDSGGSIILTNGPAGIINATGSHALIIDTGNTVVNYGLLEATGKGGLLIEDTVTNNGLIQAIGSGAHVDLSGGTIVSGELYSASGGQIDTLASGLGGTLDGLSNGQLINHGTFVVNDNSTLVVEGDFYNIGSFKISSTTHDTAIHLGANTTFDGGGSIILGASIHNLITGGGGSYTLENVNNVISGAGTIGDSNMKLANDAAGVINATSSVPLVIASSTTSTNAGLMEASGSGTLSLTTNFTNTGFVEATGKAAVLINGPTITNTGGLVSAIASGSHIDVGLATTGGSSATISGGTVSTVVGAKIDTVATKLANPANALTITGAVVNNAGTLAVGDNTILTLSGGDTVNNTGTITLGGATADTEIIIGGTTALQGGGKLTLTDSVQNSIVSNGSAATFHNVNNIISGGGTIGDSNLTLANDAAGVINSSGKTGITFDTAAFTNAGLVETTSTGGMTIADAIVNNGTLLASGTGNLEIDGNVSGTGIINVAGKATITSTVTAARLVETTAKGVLLVSGGTVGGDSVSAVTSGSHIDLDAGTLNATDIVTQAGAKIDTIANSINNEISSTTFANAGSLVVTDGSILALKSAVANTGSILVTAVKAATTLEIHTLTTLTGVGLVTLSNLALNSITSNGSTATLTNVNNTIAGAGTIGDSDLTLQNNIAGIINASGSVGLILDTDTNAIANAGIVETTSTGGLKLESNVTNTGMLIAKGTGALLVDGVTITNTSGLVEAIASNAHVDLATGAEIDHGHISTVTGSKLNVLANSSVSITDSTVLNAGSIVIASGSGLTFDGTIHGVGSLTLNAASATTTAFIIDEDTTLFGGGTVVMTDNTANSIHASAMKMLTNVDDTISGSGTIGNDGNMLILDNEGTINATGKLHALILDTGSNAVVNTGLIELTGTGGLTIDSDVTNTGGTILTNSKTAILTLDAETVTGGAVQATASGATILLDEGKITDAAVSVASGATIKTLTATTTNEIDGISLTNAGTVSVTNNSDLRLGGAITNSGTIAVNSTGAATDLLIGDEMILTGHGKLTLTNNVNNHIESDQTPGTLTNGAETATIAGSVFDVGDTVALTFTNSDISLLPETVIYTVVAGDDADAIATGLTTLINTDGALGASSIHAAFVGTGEIDISQPGTISTTTVITDAETTTGTGDESVMYGTAGTLMGGTGTPSLLENVDNTISGAGVIGTHDADLFFINEQNGVVNSNGSNLLEIDLGHQTMINFGTVESTGAGGLTVDGDMVNFGKLVVTTGTIEIGGSLTGTGTASIGGTSASSFGTLILDAASHQNITFQSTKGGALVLNDSAEFTGAITGFGGTNTDSIDLHDLAYASGMTTATFTGNNIGGVLEITNGTDTVDLTLHGNYSAVTFTVADDGSSAHGILIHDPPAVHHGLLV